MNKQEIIEKLEEYKQQISLEVFNAYDEKGINFGDSRFQAWKNRVNKFYQNNNMKNEIDRFHALIQIFGVFPRSTGNDGDDFMLTNGKKHIDYLDSLILDITNDEYDFIPMNKEIKPVEIQSAPITKSKKVFIVHGHDGEVKYRTANFLRQHGFDPIILHLKASRNRTIIEKLEKYTGDVGYGIVLYTPDDLGQVKPKASNGELDNRARQNVIFEHGYLMGKIGRENVVAIVKGDIELPNDISGIVYIDNADWEKTLLIELRDAGYPIDAANL